MTKHLPSKEQIPARPRGALVLPCQEILKTKPTMTGTKCGESGDQITLFANYFRLKKSTNWMIYQYRVDFEPEAVLDRLRKGLIYQQKQYFGGYVFDGSVLFSTRKLPDEVTTLTVKARDDTVYNITVKFTNIVSQSETQSIQIMNLILRKAMDTLKLQLVGRNFFDPDAKVSAPGDP